MSLAYVFPGQGSQYVGMGEEFLSGDLEVWFDEVCGRTEYPLRELILEGPAEELEETRVTQPAVFVVNELIRRYLNENTDVTPDFVAGHSLGEYNALCAGGWASFDDLLPVVVTRGRAMGEAADRVDGGMAALLRIDREDAEEVCREVTEDEGIEGTVQVALYNSPDQLVISGAGEALRVAVERAGDRGALKTVELDVSGPWHSEYMKPAEAPLGEALEGIDWSTGRSLVQNASASFLEGSPEENLIRQLTEPVRWIESIHRLLDEGVDTFVEVGPGDALTGMIERIIDRTDEDVDVHTTDTLEGTQTVIEAVKT